MHTRANTPPVVVDVRSPAEYAAGHVDGAINLPLDRLAQELEHALPDRAAPVLLYCQSGARSGMALQWLRQQGYQQAANGGSAGAVALQLGRGICRG